MPFFFSRKKKHSERLSTQLMMSLDSESDTRSRVARWTSHLQSQSQSQSHEPQPLLVSDQESESTSPIFSPESKSTLPIYDPDDESTWPPFVSSRRAQLQL